MTNNEESEQEGGGGGVGKGVVGGVRAHCLLLLYSGRSFVRRINYEKVAL